MTAPHAVSAREAVGLPPQAEHGPSPHPTCCVCSAVPTAGLHMIFSAGPTDTILCRHSFESAWEGYPGFVHGGMLAAALDGAMTNWLLRHDLPAVTAELVVRYRHPVPTGVPVLVRAWHAETSGPILEMAAELTLDGQRMATAKAKFVRNAASARITESPGAQP